MPSLWASRMFELTPYLLSVPDGVFSICAVNLPRPTSFHVEHRLVGVAHWICLDLQLRIGVGSSIAASVRHIDEDK